ncbi:MAG: NAD-dependent malic enzyme [Acidobacteriota bacterium]
MQDDNALEIIQEPEAQEIDLHGAALLEDPLLNKGSGFTEAERSELGLIGLLPYHHSPLAEQVERTYENFLRLGTPLEKYIYLMSLQDRNETLFYRLVGTHITEMMPIIYTPTVGLGCQVYSHIFRRPRGLYISYPYRNQIGRILSNTPQTGTEVIVVTDGERILGLGDQGVGGMGIPVGKLSLYTLCAGIHPRTTLPIILDVGTNNPERLADPLYLGWRHERIRGAEYDDFVEAFVVAVQERFPNVLLQWEDFSKQNAPRLLDRYRDRVCSFNDDIQGTGAVTLAGMLAAMRIRSERLRDQRIVILGAGASASGISDQIVTAMINEGAGKEEARAAIWQIDRQGLVHTGRENLEATKQRYARPAESLRDWPASGGEYSFATVVRKIQPTILIGTSAQPGAFTEEIVREMASHTARPIIFPLSNPTSKSEADPADLFQWTEGRVLTATGSPFPDVEFAGRRYRIGQCNNAFIFPGVGLGIVAVQATRVSDGMFVAAAEVLSRYSPALADPGAALYPELIKVREISRAVALAVAREALRSGLASPIPDEDLLEKIDAKMWIPHYVPYHRRSHAAEVAAGHGAMPSPG